MRAPATCETHFMLLKFIYIYHTPFEVLCIIKIIDFYSGFLDMNHIRKIMIDHFHGLPVSVTEFIVSK
jgi:hypothetical protein